MVGHFQSMSVLGMASKGFKRAGYKPDPSGSKSGSGYNKDPNPKSEPARQENVGGPSPPVRGLSPNKARGHWRLLFSKRSLFIRFKYTLKKVYYIHFCKFVNVYCQMFISYAHVCVLMIF